MVKERTIVLTTAEAEVLEKALLVYEAWRWDARESFSDPEAAADIAAAFALAKKVKEAT
mgnify:CR=1 FL=1